MPYNNSLLQASTGAWERSLASVGLALWLYRANVKDSPFYCGVGNTDHFGPQCFFGFVLFCFSGLLYRQNTFLPNLHNQKEA